MAEAEMAPLSPASTSKLDGTKGMLNTTANGVVLSETQLGNMALRAKKERKRAEEDRELLQNRINRLLIEQERASKRITETRRRTEEIMKLKERNTQHQMAQQDASAWLVSEQELQKELLQQDRAQRSTAIATSRQTMYSMRKEEVSVLKQMRSENERAVQEQRALEYERAKERKQVVRSSQKEALGRKFQEQQKAVEENRRKREQARQELDDDALSHLEAYTGLAAEEQRLIASLQKWQDVQDDAFTQLDGVMSGSGKARHGSRPVSRSTAGALTPREPATPVADGAA